MATAIAADVTGAFRDLGTGLDAQGRVLGTSVRHLVTSGELAGARVARELTAPPTQLLKSMAAVTAALLGPAALRRPSAHQAADDWGIVDRAITRC